MNDYERWWEVNLGTPNNPTLKDFKTWMGDPNDPTRKRARSLIMKGAKTFLDVGCGAAPEYYGLKIERPEIAYAGLDITPKIVDHIRGEGINAFKGRIQEIPFGNNAFDVVHTRHVLEHLPHFNDALHELVRVAKYQVIISFFIEPKPGKTHIHLDGAERGTKLYHNQYSKEGIQTFLILHHKVKAYHWITNWLLNIKLETYHDK
jgi:ubiquinone/menaquinone biosynthesis C-methylase UbiE